MLCIEKSLYLFNCQEVTSFFAHAEKSAEIWREHRHVFKKSWNLALLCALSVLLLSILPCVVWADQNGAANAIANARNQILTCFDAIRKTETAGANITELTVILNRAGSLLSQAEFAFSTEDFAAAEDYAAQSQVELANFVSEADALLFSASTRKNQDFLVNVVGSIFGTGAVLVGSWGLWAFLNKRRRNNEKNEVRSYTV